MNKTLFILSAFFVYGCELIEVIDNKVDHTVEAITILNESTVSPLTVLYSTPGEQREIRIWNEDDLQKFRREANRCEVPNDPMTCDEKFMSFSFYHSFQDGDLESEGPVTILGRFNYVIITHEATGVTDTLEVDFLAETKRDTLPIVEDASGSLIKSFHHQLMITDEHFN